MKVLVANLGSTSFKFRLFDMKTETQLARGGIERIGDSQSAAMIEIGDFQSESSIQAADHAAAVHFCLSELTDSNHGCLEDVSDVAAIGFKAVHGGRISGTHLVDDEVLQAMEEMSQVAPAHNPPYVAAMRQLAQAFPSIPLVAAFETGFHQTIPPRLRHYAVPFEWAEEHQLQRWGFHGASHRFIATRTAELMPDTSSRVISCHLGGSSSVCAIRDGESLATTMGMSPQSGIPQNNRVGELDPFALLHLEHRTGESHHSILARLGKEGGLLGISGISGDIRDLQQAADDGNERAQLALDVYTTSIRHYLGAYLLELGGADAIVFTGGIGQYATEVRSSVCADLESFGIVVDDAKNRDTRTESPIHHESSQSQVWVIPTNEELIVGRQVHGLLRTS